MAAGDLDTELTVLEGRVNAAREELRVASDLGMPAQRRLQRAVEKVGESASGSWIGYHARLYYGRFQRPPWQHSFSAEWGAIRGLPEGWEERDPEEVEGAIEAVAGTKLDQLEAVAGKIEALLKPLKKDMCITLAPIGQIPGLDAEVKLLADLDALSLRLTAQDFLDVAKPNTVWSRDTLALSQRVQIPPHVHYQARLVAATSVFIKGEECLDMADRLVRQVRAQLRALAPPSAPPLSDPVARVVRLCRRFHLVALQLRERQRERAPFGITDEYDVQDLVHALLRLDFDDVRPEEHAPSRAGAPSRLDFLLKEERIVLEVKMPRAGTTMKKVGDELLIDIGRYQAHPDCGTLVCFVYDPERMLSNPRGLEADLERNSTDARRVIAVVAQS